MKKFKFIILLAILIFVLSGICFAGESISYKFKPSFNYIVGFDLPNFGWAEKNPQNEIIGFSGFNLGFGYSEKNYFQPYEFHKFNTFWGWGTVALIIPYFTIGGDYPIPLNDYSAINISAGFVLLSPYVSLSFCW